MSGIQVTFDDPTNNRNGYRIYTSTDEGSTWTQQVNLDPSAASNGTVTYTVTGLDDNTAYHVKASVYTDHVESEVIYGRVAKRMTRSSVMTGDSQIDASRGGMAKTRSAGSHADGEISVTRTTSKTRSAQINADGELEATRSGVDKQRTSILQADAEINTSAQFSEAFPSELTRDLEWDYNFDRMGFESEWVHRSSSDGQDVVSLYMDVIFGRVDPVSPIVIVDFDRTGNGEVDERSNQKSIYNTQEPVVFPSLSGDEGYYRVLMSDLRPSDIINSVMFGPSHT